jgi:hypothetical protein
VSDDLFGDVFSLPTPSRAPAAAATDTSVSQAPAFAAADEPSPPPKAQSLAEVVRELRTRQRGVEALVLRASRSIDAAERQGAQRAVGLEDMASFVDQSLGEGSLLRDLLARARTSGLPQAPRKRAKAGRRPAKQKQNKKESSDAAFGRACAFVSGLRALEIELRERIVQSKGLLGEIEREGLFREGGYASFEDFLDRAIGASPVFGTTLVLLGDELPEMAAAPERLSRLTMPVDSYEFVLTSLPAPAAQAAIASTPSAKPPASAVASVPSARAPASSRLSSMLAIAISAVVAIAVGSVAGILASPHGMVAAASPGGAHHDESSAEPSASGEVAHAPAEAPAEHAAAEAASPEHASAEHAPAFPSPHGPSTTPGVRPAPLAPARPRAADHAGAEPAASPLPTVSPLPGFRVAEK